MLSSGSETILLVEDQEQVLMLTQNVLAGCGYQVLSCGNALSALQLAGAHDGTIHLLLTDVVMPDMSGPELADRLKALRPSCKVLYMSGYSGDAIAHRGILDVGVAYLAKPFSAAQLSSKVRDVLGSGRG
jgi:CheY-like chemotaxis protein